MYLMFGTFVLCIGLVAFLTWYFTRGGDTTTSDGYYLAGRGLTFPLIAGSLLLTNLSTEQMVGLNGAAYIDGLCVMVWEVVCVIALVFMAWFFLPKFLKSGVATVPQYLEIRYDHTTQLITNCIFLVAYVAILLPIILCSGAQGLIGILDVPSILGEPPAWIGMDARTFALWVTVWTVGIIGSIYALFGGLRTVAVSDTLNGVGLLIGGFLIAGFALSQLGDGDIVAGASGLYEGQRERFNSIGGPKTKVPFSTIFTGIILINFFYWTTNQQIIQRTFGASSLAEGQKGVLLTGALKLLGPLYLVIPGMIAYAMFHESNPEMEADHAYGALVHKVLPPSLTGFFAAAMIGAILSSFNSALNSACTLFSLGFFKGIINDEVSNRRAVRYGKIFGWIIAVISMIVAPFLDRTKSIFDYLQGMNTIYFIPIFAVVVVGMLTKRVPSLAAKLALSIGPAVIALGFFVPPFTKYIQDDRLHKYHFVGIVFWLLVLMMLLIGYYKPRSTDFVQQDVGAVDMTQWKWVKPVGVILILMVIAIYATFARF